MTAAQRRCLGLLVPPAGNAVPPEAEEVIAEGIEVVARGLGIAAMAPEDFDRGLERLESTVQELLGIGVDAISVMGTSLTFYRGRAGNEAVLERLRVAAGGLPVTTMSTSVVQALGRLRARRVAVVGAYTEGMTARLAEFLAEHGLDVASAVNLGIESISEVAGVKDDVLQQAVLTALGAAGGAGGAGGADAVLISCGGLQPGAVARAVQRDFGIPVVSSSVDGMRAAVDLLPSNSFQGRMQGLHTR